ncbi:MAG: hypothetical protein LBG68_03510 [Coriobacteriales bacterium]|jgi:hypothetical protein|nr:hypothetical protein [Coriobacteriales bacterium]
MRKSTVAISLVIALLCAYPSGILTGCQEKQTQEEFQVEYKDRLSNMIVYIDPEYYIPGSVYADQWAPDCLAYSDQLLVCIRAYELFDGSKTIPTYDEMKLLYSEYDEAVYEEFMVLYRWYTANNQLCVLNYGRALHTALRLYEAEYGPFRESDHWANVEEMIHLEDFIREHPDLMPREQYAEELSWLGID